MECRYVAIIQIPRDRSGGRTIFARTIGRIGSPVRVCLHDHHYQYGGDVRPVDFAALDYYRRGSASAGGPGSGGGGRAADPETGRVLSIQQWLLDRYPSGDHGGQLPNAGRGWNELRSPDPRFCAECPASLALMRPMKRLFSIQRYSTLTLLLLLWHPQGVLAGPSKAKPTPTPVASCSCVDNSPDSLEANHPKGSLRPLTWADMPAIDSSQVGAPLWQALLLGCGVLPPESLWSDFCSAAQALAPEASEQERLELIESRLSPWQAVGADGQAVGLATGYYEPILHGSKQRSDKYRYPLYAAPDDLLTVELDSIVPELKGRRVRGRLLGQKVVPYFTRADIEGDAPPDSLRGREIVWIDDPVEVFFLHIQGSGRVELDEGGALHVGYADQNGQPFRSVARLLIERGELSVGQASLQGMKAWAEAHPDRVSEFLNANPSYVFFRELPGDLPGPIGTLGSPLIGQGSVAVDARWIPLGAPVYLETTRPLTQTPLKQLAMAQDTGGAINGAVRIDYFWGLGDAALAEAGRMRQALKLWVLLPRGTHSEGGDLVLDPVPLLQR